MFSTNIQTIISFVVVFLIKGHFSDLVSKNKWLITEPDLNITEIPENVKHLCGYKQIPFERVIKFSHKCFGTEFTKNISELKKPDIKDAWPSMRIMNGIDADMHESPWTVQLAEFGGRFADDYHYRCTGVLITLKHILTAAHCHL